MATSTILTLLGTIIVVLVIIIAICYVKAPPKDAYIISGISKQPRILIGKGGFRIPGDTQKKTRVSVKKIDTQRNEKGDAERYLTNINELAACGKIQHVKGNEYVIDRILTVLSKRERNNVVIVGEPGVGKTATVKHLSNLLLEDSVPEAFCGKVVLQMDFANLLIGTAMRGGFKTKMASITADASKKGKYIFFVDDIHSVLSSGARMSELPVESVLEEILGDKNIQFICTTTPDGYSKYIQTNPYLYRRLHKIEIDEVSVEKCEEIISDIVDTLSSYHGVEYPVESVRDAIKLSKRHITGRKLPDSAIDVLDEAGAVISLHKKEDERLSSLKDELLSIEERKTEIEKNQGGDAYSDYDEIVKEEISKKNEIAVLKKELKRKEKKPVVSSEDVRSVISSKTGVPVESIGTDERARLKGLEERLNNIVIGQKEAVSNVCKAIRRKRCGMADGTKPVVLFFSGATGCGKTYLAKTLSNELFGDEGKLVRLDMSEYTEKMSVTRLYGSSAGYVGYDDGGILTEAVKKNRRCILLLDEIEKANDEVFNVFLQVFDEGRLTDNKGVVVDFKDTVIIMTSNIGSKEISESGKAMGFVREKPGERDYSIVMSAIKKRFRPEFVNRLDNIVLFNRLGDEELKNIIRLEIEKVDKRVVELGYALSNEIKEGEYVEKVLDTVKEESEYGARPVIREIQRTLEDRLTDIIIDDNPEKGYCFSLNDIYHK